MSSTFINAHVLSKINICLNVKYLNKLIATYKLRIHIILFSCHCRLCNECQRRLPSTPASVFYAIFVVVTSCFLRRDFNIETMRNGWYFPYICHYCFYCSHLKFLIEVCEAGLLMLTCVMVIPRGPREYIELVNMWRGY